MQKQKVFNSIYIWRIVFTLLVMIFHFNNIFNIYQFLGLSGKLGWYISVEFFFIVSGFLLYKKAEKDSKQSSVSVYIVERIKKIYPPYIMAYVLTFATLVYYNDDLKSIIAIYEHFIDNFFEAIMLQGIGFQKGVGYINPLAWYISTLLIASYLIYYLLTKHREFFENIIAPIMIIVCYAWIHNNRGSTDVTVIYMENFYINGSLMRGLAGMCMGVYAAKLNACIERKICDGQISDTQCKVMRILGVVAFLYVIIASIQYGYSQADFVYVLILTYAVAIGFLPWKKYGINEKGDYVWWAKPIVYLSEISLSLYLLHQMYREWIFPNIFNDIDNYSCLARIGIMILYIIAVVITAILVDIITKRLPNYMSVRKKK